MTTQDTLFALFSRHAQSERPLDGSSWLQDLGLDSIAMMALVVDIEDEFRVVLDQGTLLGLRTVTDLGAWIDQQREGT